MKINLTNLRVGETGAMLIAMTLCCLGFIIWAIELRRQDALERCLLKHPKNLLLPPELQVQLVASRVVGRLGDEMFKYAALLGISRRNNRTPLWLDSTADVIYKSFEIPMTIDCGNLYARNKDSNFSAIRERDCYEYENSTERLPLRNISLDGFFQSRKYFEFLDEELRAHFTFRKHISDAARMFVQKRVLKISKNENWDIDSVDVDVTVVAIHVHRGDMLDEYYIKRGVVQSNSSYFQRAVNHFKGIYSHVVFIVLSDDMGWCRANIRGRTVVYALGHSVYEDLAMSSFCDHAIITFGTYGLWVAWFANGQTVRPRDVPAPGSFMARTLYNKSHYYPDHCIVL